MRRLYTFETFLVSLAVILLEVSYTRVFSYKLVYYFTYVVIGISLLGLGSGGVFVAIFERLRRMEADLLIRRCALTAAVAVGAGYLIVAETPLNLFRMVMQASAGNWAAVAGEGVKLAIVLVVLFLPFLFAGIALAKIFATQTDAIGRLYFVDLLGAGLGCAIVIPAMKVLTPPGAVLLAGCIFSIATLRLASQEGQSALRVTGVLVGLLALASVLGGRLPDPVRDRVKGRDDAGTVFSRWSPVFRVDVVPVPGADPPTNFLVHDGTLGSSMIQYDGNPASLGRYDKMDRAYPFRLLKPKPKVAIIGSAGGNEILASLHFDASHVTGIELNPVTVSLLREHFADFTGHLTENPRVTVVNAEGRAYLKGAGERYDLIWLVAPDSYAAMNAASSGAFVLSESYLYTQEMIEEALEHLEPDGILCAQFGEIDFAIKPNRVMRYLATARQAFQTEGISDFSRHVMVAVSPGFKRLDSATILLKKSPFTDADVATFERTVTELPEAKVIYSPRQPNPESLIGRAITLDAAARDDLYRKHPYQIGAISDDSPFFWHFVGFDDAVFGGSGTQQFNVEEGIGERLLFALFAFSTLFAAVFLLLPLVAMREVWAVIPHKWSAGVYFASLGLGFMFIEVSLIQKLTLFLGYPTYSLTVTLFSLLISTGVGSLVSERYAAVRNRAYLVLLTALFLLVIGYRYVLTPLLASGVGLPFAVRILVTIGALAPLGLVLGAFMPLGLRSVSQATPYGQQYVAWCWAVNGFFSVMASVLATMLSMTLGFTMVMYIGLLIYAVGVFAFMRVPEPRVA